MSSLSIGEGGFVTMVLADMARPVGARPMGHRGAAAPSLAGAPGGRGRLLPSLLLPRGLCDERFTWGGLLSAALVGANACALVYLGRRAWAQWADQREQLERQRTEQEEVTRAALTYLQRLWEVAMRGDSGPPLDLGLPDPEGVFSYEGADGTRLFFRPAPRDKDSFAGGGGGRASFAGGGGGGGGAPQWEWSTSGRLWLPTSAADSIWFECGEGRSPGLGGRLLIRRLELEAQLAAATRTRMARAASEPFGSLPPLDLPGLSPAASGGGDAVAVIKPRLPLSASAAALDRRYRSDDGMDSLQGESPRGDAAFIADVPDSFMCPLSGGIMTDPVVTPGGVTYERSAAIDFIRRHGRDPVTGHAIDETELYPNLAIRDQICGYFLVRDCINNSH